MAQAAVRAASSSSAAMPLVVRATAQGSLRPQRSAHAAPRNKLVAATASLDVKRHCGQSKREFRHTDGTAGTCRGATLSFEVDSRGPLGR